MWSVQGIFVWLPLLKSIWYPEPDRDIFYQLVYTTEIFIRACKTVSVVLQAAYQ